VHNRRVHNKGSAQQNSAQQACFKNRIDLFPSSKFT
jgi:hypothetical protein